MVIPSLVTWPFIICQGGHRPPHVPRLFLSFQSPSSSFPQLNTEANSPSLPTHTCRGCPGNQTRMYVPSSWPGFPRVLTQYLFHSWAKAISFPAPFLQTTFFAAQITSSQLSHMTQHKKRVSLPPYSFPWTNKFPLECSWGFLAKQAEGWNGVKLVSARCSVCTAKTNTHCGLIALPLRDLGWVPGQTRGNVLARASLFALVATPTTGPAGKHSPDPADDSACLFQISHWPSRSQTGSWGALLRWCLSTTLSADSSSS